MLPDVQARYNRKWSGRLLLLCAVLLLFLLTGDYLDDYSNKAAWKVMAMPILLTLLAGIAALPLPRALRPPLYAAFWIGVTFTLFLAAFLAFLDFYASNFMRGR